MTKTLIATANQQAANEVKQAWAAHRYFTRIEFDAPTKRWFAAVSYKSGIMAPVTPGRFFR